MEKSAGRNKERDSAAHSGWNVGSKSGKSRLTNSENIVGRIENVNNLSWGSGG